MPSPIVAVASALKASYRFGLSFFSANKKKTKTRSGKMDTGFTDYEEEERYGSSYGPWSIDVHPTKPWALLTLGTHYVEIWNYRCKCLHINFELPAGHIRRDARCGKFIARKDWVVAGFTGGFIAVYNYSTKKEVAIFSAHRLVVTSVAVHPFLPYVLSSSGNELIKLWDWENGWACIRIFEGHSTSVTHIAFNPKDPNTFASASHDTTIKVWNLGSSCPDFTLDGHEDIVNCVDYYTGDNRPYLISGSYDGTAKVWDYETKTCIQTLKGNNNFFTAACFHPQLPIIITGSSDGEVCYWDSITYRLDNVQDYGSKVGCIVYTKGFERFATILASRFNVIKLRHDRPVASIHPESGTILLAKHNKILKSHIRTDKAHYKVTDGERLSLATEELCPIDMYPQYMKHSPNGRSVVIGGEGEYVILKTLKKYIQGYALEFVWSSNGEYALRQSTSNIKIFTKDVQVKTSYKLLFPAERIFGGRLLAICCSKCIYFFEWEHCKLIRRIEIARVQNVYWAGSGDLVAITTDTSLLIYKYRQRNAGFEYVHDANERVESGLWVDYKCFIYVNSSWRLNYCVGDEVTTFFYLDRPMYLLGYIASLGCVYLSDMELNVVGCTLPPHLINYKRLMMNGDIRRANSIVPHLPIKHCDR